MSPESATFSKGSPADVVFTVTGANSVTKVADEDGTTVETTNYTFSADKLTVLDDYLSTLDEAAHTLTVETDAGTFSVTITVGA